MPLLIKSTLVRTVLTPILRPFTRVVVGLLAIPLVRMIRRRIPGMKELDAEFEKDIDQWFRGSLILLVATKNAELALEGWLNTSLGDVDFHLDLNHWYFAACRLLLAVSCIEAMPDQELFSIIHPGPKFQYDKCRGFWGCLRDQWRQLLKGVICQHLNRSSPVLAIMAVIFDGTAGWVCYLLAIAQYLFIGLVTSRDRAMDILSEFDREVARRRRELVEEFQGDNSPSND
ncbi:MAG: DNA topoisomerase I [Planctomycetaceae bacterium]